jgi:hypothetical protein
MFADLIAIGLGAVVQGLDLRETGQGREMEEGLVGV